MNRRNLLQLSMLTLVFGELGHASSRKSTQTGLYNNQLEKFIKWTKTCQPSSGMGMVSYFANLPNSNKQQPLSTIASANLLLFFLKINDVDSAKKIGDGLIFWQNHICKHGSRYTKGGLPTEIVAKRNKWVAGNYFYASDNLIVAFVLSELYVKTNLGKYADGVRKLSKWLMRELFDGVYAKAWKVNYGPPMNYITTNGDVDNTIHTAGNFLWLKALPRLHDADNEAGWNETFVQSKKFLANAQMESGAWYSFFKPSKHSEKGEWYGFKGQNLVLGDDNLRSALAAFEFGMKSNIDNFKKWLAPHDDTLLWGYLHTEKSTPNFLSSDKPYFDVVCTGLLRSWYRKNGQFELAEKCQNILDGLQNPDGSWTWGVFEEGLVNINEEKAMLTGCWALADLV